LQNDFIGVFRHSTAANALEARGLRPAWHWGDFAVAGAPVGMDRSRAIVVCGEVLLDNAAELRACLDRPDASDHDLLAELYAAHGTRAGLYALGMFSAVVCDTRVMRVVLLRDGVGARTLYHARAGQVWWFAGRLAALERCPGVSREVSLPALRDYLSCAFVPGEQTLRRDIHEVRPGTALHLPEGRTETWWEPAERIEDPNAPMEVHASRLRAVLDEAVRCRLPASGPTALFLSGGVDSSLVAALAARMAPGPVHTFAIHFGKDLPNELEWSSLVARHCGTRHHVVELPGRQIRDTLMETMAALDDPIGDPLTVPNLILGREAAREAPVILNGEGGDPCFGGPKNTPMLLHALYGAGESLESVYLRSFQKCYDDLPRLLTPDAHAALRDAPPTEEVFRPYLSGSPMEHYLNRLMHLNTRLKGADHILTKVNNLTSANGVLGRSPLFDRRVVEASFAIPPEMKLEGTVEKAVLKRAVADLLPREIIERPKSGMLVPVQAWFRKDLRRHARDQALAAVHAGGLAAGERVTRHASCVMRQGEARGAGSRRLRAVMMHVSRTISHIAAIASGTPAATGSTRCEVYRRSARGHRAVPGARRRRYVTRRRPLSTP
jgi:asparagine synthase (glutamine-hydrolysing)